MKLCKTRMVRIFLLLPAAIILLAVLPAVAQRGTLGVDVGETSDRFSNLPRYTDPAGDVNGEVAVLHSAKGDWPDVLVGGEIRFPSDTNHHASELAIYGGLGFHATPSLSIGFHVQIRKIYVPSSVIDNQTFIRNNMELLETPVFVQYKFGPEKHVFVRAEGAPEFHPRFRTSSNGPSPLPNPDLDHAYFVKGTVGYSFGKWYAKASYDTRYFKFASGLANPNGYNNWRSDFATVGVGLNF